MSKWSRTPIIKKQIFAYKIVTQSLGNIHVKKKCFERHKDLRIFDVALLGLFSRRFGAGKQVGAQSGFGGLELLENFITSWV